MEAAALQWAEAGSHVEIAEALRAATSDAKEVVFFFFACF